MMTKYIIYGKSSCPYCIKVITSLVKSGKTFYAEMLDHDLSRLEELKTKYGHPTIPIVLIKTNTEKLLGGCDDTINHIKQKTPDAAS